MWGASKLDTTVVTLSRTATRKKANLIKPWKKVASIIVFIVCVISMFYVNRQVEVTLDYILAAFGTVPFIYFLFKMVFSFLYKPDIKEPLPGIKVSVVVPCYNEKPKAVEKTLECLINQDYPIHEIFFIDDGSKDTSGYETAKKLADEIDGWREVAATVLDHDKRNAWAQAMTDLPQIIVHRFEKNQGKRAAQVWGFRQATGDVIMIVDSDGYIYPDAVRELLKPFHDPEVVAVTGHVNARNKSENFMTRLQDVLYESAFRVGRGAMSVTGDVLVCSGAISMFKREVVLNNIDVFANQMWFGKPMNIGDDRRLTTISLKVGKVKYQSTARCITDVPTSVRQFFKQQVRWSKSFYIESVNQLRVALKKRSLMMIIWILGEGLIWAMFGSTVLTSLAFSPWALKNVLFIYACSYFVLSALANNVYYIFKNLHLYLLSPFFGLIHTLLLYPIRVYALLTIRRDKWATR